jgi:hypothetical protein
MRVLGLVRSVRRAALGLGAVLAVPLGACGSSTSAAAASHHRLKGLVLTEVVGGGFVPADIGFALQLPQVAVFADGRVFTVKASSVGVGSKAALTVLIERALPVSAVNRIVNLAEAAGVTGHPPDVGRPRVTDLPTTSFTLRLERTATRGR